MRRDETHSPTSINVHLPFGKSICTKIPFFLPIAQFLGYNLSTITQKAPEPMAEHLIAKLVEGEALAPQELAQGFAELLDGQWSEVKTAAFLTALRSQPLLAEHLIAAAQALRERMVPIEYPQPVFDPCGTGGDRQSTINISTAVALVVAAAGVKVAKHGNRSVSSTSGSSDVLSVLGVQIDLPAERVQACLDGCNLGFCFAPRFHPCLRALAPLRKQLGFVTIFNQLGPLCNPARAARQLIGVGRREYLEPMAGALIQLGAERAAVVHGQPTMDEVTLEGETEVMWAEYGKLTKLVWRPVDFGMQPMSVAQLRSYSPEESAARILAVLQDKDDPGKPWIVANSAASLLIANRVKSLQEGVQLAQEMIRSGQALQTLDRLRVLSGA